MMDYNKLMSSVVQGIPTSGIRKFFDLMENMENAISLGIGEPDYATPWHIRDAGIYSLEKGFTKYTPNAGMSSLREEISKYMKRRFSLEYDSLHQLLVTVGGSEAIDLTVRVLVNPGDEVIIPVPSFVCYGPIVEMAHGVPVYVDTKVENEFRLTPEELEAAITPKTKLLILPYPNNPTGGIMRGKDLEAIAQVLKDTDIMVLSDEIYAELTYGQKHVSIANIDGMYERTIVVNGFSKSYSMTGWRLGYACGPEAIIKQMTKVHQYGIMSAPTTSQYAAIEALKEGDKDIEVMKQDYDRRRKLLHTGLKRIGLPCFEPRGAFYMFPSIKDSGMTSEEFSEKFLIQEHVAVIPGTAFSPNGEGFVRMCYAASVENLTEALNRLQRFMNSIK